MAPGLGTMADHICIIPGLSTNKKVSNPGALLRRPRAPKLLPPLSADDQSEPEKKENELGSVIAMFQNTFDLEALRGIVVEPEIISARSRAPSLASPPPPSEYEANNHKLAQVNYNIIQKNTWHKSFGNNRLLITNEDMKYVLDPLLRGKTSLGTYIDGKSLVKPLKYRGPDPLPRRAARRNVGVLINYDVDDQRFFEPPAFTLEHFIYKMAEMKNLSVPRVRKIVYSKHNVKKLTDMLAQVLNPKTQDSLHTINFDASEIPMKENRIPQKQLLYEMAALIKEHVRDVIGTDVKSVIRPMPKYSPDRTGTSRPHTEIILYEDDKKSRTSTAVRIKQDTETPGVDAVVYSAHSRVFQGSERSRSPFAAPEDETITPSELAILDTLIAGGTALSMKAHFIDDLPDISPLAQTLTYVNLSFNNFKVFPIEVLDLPNLEVLKLRNNPLIEIPGEIIKLQKLRVLIASFCLISALPSTLFTLPHLDDLSLSYNRLTFLPSEVATLQSLKVLDLEGNQLPALPASCLFMANLAHVNVRNNFMHPLFWRENTKNKPQNLLDLSCVQVYKMSDPSMHYLFTDDVIKALSRVEECDCCRGPLFGPGLRTICPVPRLFTVKNMPFLFRACTPTCLTQFKEMKPEALAVFLYGQ
ncbi:uncharacterized protein LOC131947097 isoform X2 [Physella acuta]|uniref:uncharacterized protein LOC131947097 isoform X2 n=1 Tax=Physella acuta TaxID=109671 RepID=UPI0027DB6253|nr:uncharacterized protein LOC131947097 isoform X2 [Physella acuta]